MLTEIELEFADGRYLFRLGLAQISEVQQKTGSGIGALYARVLAGRYLVAGESMGVNGEAKYAVADIIEPIRQGLIGGGKGEVDGQPVNVTSIVANRLIENYVLNRPLSEAWTIAAAVLTACIVGYQPETAKKKPRRAKASPTADASIILEPSPTAQ